jgi:HEAT repeat protein
MKIDTSPLQEALRGPYPFVAAEAARLIGEFNLRALIPDLIENARFYRFYSKVSSFYALAKLSAQEAIPHLKNLVADPHVSDDWYWHGSKGVRAAAAVSLLQLGDASGVPYLRELAEARDMVFFRWFAPALLRLKPVPELQACLTLDHLCSAEKRNAYAGPEYTEPGMLCMLGEALALIPDPRADEHLEFYLNYYSRFVRGQAYRSFHLRHQDKATAQKIKETAAKHGTDFDRLVAAEVGRDSAVLVEIARQAPAAFDRGSAIDALGAIASPQLVEAAKPGLEDKDAYVRRCAVESLARRQGQEAQQHFAKLLESEKDATVRCALAASQSGAKDSSC